MVDNWLASIRNELRWRVAQGDPRGGSRWADVGALRGHKQSNGRQRSQRFIQRIRLKGGFIALHTYYSDSRIKCPFWGTPTHRQGRNHYQMMQASLVTSQAFMTIRRSIRRTIFVNQEPHVDPFRSEADVDQMQLNFDLAIDVRNADQNFHDKDAQFFIARMRNILEQSGSTPHDMRKPCACGCPLGVLTIRGNQNSVSCARCKTFIYNAPKTETGQKQRTVRTLRQTIKPAQQARVLDRDHGRCVLCGTADELTIGHLLSIADGCALGAIESELNHDANLAAMCEGCNAGLGSRSVSTRTYLIIMLKILQAEIRRLGPAR